MDGPLFRFPIRSAEALGYENSPDEQKSDEDIAADLNYQDTALEDFLSQELPRIYVQQSALGSGFIDPTQLATGTPQIGEAPVWGGLVSVWTDIATQAELDAHITDPTDSHDASAISFVPTGTISSTDVQAAIAEVASEAGGGSTMAMLLMGG